MTLAEILFTIGSSLLLVTVTLNWYCVGSPTS